MNREDFDLLFISDNFSNSLFESIVGKFDSLFGFHNAIANYGKFKTYRLAQSLGYDVEFKIDTFKSSYGEYWNDVKNSVDEQGWTYAKEVPNMLDSYFESNTGKNIEFQKSFGPSGENPFWKTKGSRWRPKDLTD